jgi:hypothetical protein
MGEGKGRRDEPHHRWLAGITFNTSGKRWISARRGYLVKGLLSGAQSQPLRGKNKPQELRVAALQFIRFKIELRLVVVHAWWIRNT